MGNAKSTHEHYSLFDEPTINVLFVQVKPKSGCKISPEQFNLILGLNTPNYTTLEGTPYYYVFCVHDSTDINTIANEYGYEIGYIDKDKVLKSTFNSNHKIYWSYLRDKRFDLRLKN
jgi:hypothetical protein